MYGQSASKRMGLLRNPNTQIENQAVAIPSNAGDELPQQLHAWCIKMNLMPPRDLPSVEELSNLCRGNARPALSYIIRHYQPRNRVLAFRRAQAAKAGAAKEEEAKSAERSRLEEELRDKDAEVERWKEEVDRLEAELKETNRRKREWDRQTEEYEEQTRLLTMKAVEMDSRLRSHKLTSEYLGRLAPSQPSGDAPKLTEQQKTTLIARLKAAGNDEKAIVTVMQGVGCEELHDCLLHEQLRLVRKAEELATQHEDSESLPRSALAEEVSRMQHEIARTKMAALLTAAKNRRLVDEQEELAQECVDAMMESGQDRLVDVVPSSTEALRIVESVSESASAKLLHAKLEAAQQEEQDSAQDLAQVAPIGRGKLRAQQHMHSLIASVHDSLSALVASKACADESHAQALTALADSSLPGDAAQFRALVCALEESICSVDIAEESTVEPTLQQRVIEARQFTAKHRNAQKYLSALKSLDLPSVRPIDESAVASARAADSAATAALIARLTKLGDETAAAASKAAAVCEAAAHCEHPVRTLVPADAVVGGKRYHEWEELCTAAFANKSLSESSLSGRFCV